MKHSKILLPGLLLVCMLFTTAAASPVPEEFRQENLNGQQRIVKTYTLPPDIDPATLTDPDFDYDGYRYTWAYTLRDEHHYTDAKRVTETVTVETAKKDLDVILEQLAPSIPYEKDGYSGELALDHTSLVTEASGYTTRRSTVTETKVIGPLDRNDMSYVPATTVKNGKTLSLSSVEWQVIGTDLVGDVLAPSSYQAVATYSGSSSYQAATGYVTTAEYKGDVISSGVESITYTVVYTGTELKPVEPMEPLEPVASDPPAERSIDPNQVLIPLLGVLLIAALAAIAAALFLYLRRKDVFLYVPTAAERDYELVSKRTISKEDRAIDIQGLDPYPTGAIAVEIKRRTARKLAGMTVTVLYRGGTHTYTIGSGNKDDWHEFELPQDNITAKPAEVSK